MNLFATHPLGFSDLLEQELLGAGAQITARVTSGIGFTGTLECAYRVCLWSRIANRVLLQIGDFDAPEPDALYYGVQRTTWLEHLTSNCSIAVDFTTTHSQINHSLYGAQRVKDAIVDQLRESSGVRPNVDIKAPDVRINVHLQRDRASLAIDLSGESLHRRGYRQVPGPAPLKENLAAALLLRAGWPQIALAGGALLDPMCGSGTLPIEALLMACDIAPNLARRQFGFTRWRGHQPDLWAPLIEEAGARRDAGLLRAPIVRGSDVDARAVAAARANIAAAGLAAHISVDQRALRDIMPPAARGLLITNPPYGERLADKAELPELFTDLGAVLRSRFDGWRASVLAPDAELGFRTGLRLKKKHAARNGALDVVLLTFEISAEQTLPPRAERATPALDPAIDEFSNRIRKNQKRLARWARRQAVTCYRIYDADLPDFAFAIDLYHGNTTWLHVQEYAPPASIDAQRAQLRRDSLLAVLPALFGVAADQVFIKTRERQRGTAQYTRRDDTRVFQQVEERGCQLLVNLGDYLDTGLFLDHRLLRQRIQSEASGKRFLNLYAYTGSATVHAIRGGASSTTSVDLSNTYLNWALRNFELNTEDLRTHRLVRADCKAWLDDAVTGTDRYDLILLDPPSFSNSKSTDDVLDIQRDHVALIRACVALLATNGTLYFSSNMRRFKLDEAALADLDIENITASTIDEDFRRSPRVHQCWRIGTSNDARQNRLPRPATAT
jgi:23S rRNA (guanine2445-N2)-methyltransferase / 23S rRNA (guanine2069-N7)-methyltransferase